MPAPHSSNPERHQKLLDNLGVLFYNVRQELGITQREAAKRSGTIQGRISDIENGKGNPHLTTLENLAMAYGYHVEFALIPMNQEEVDGPEGAGVQSRDDSNSEGAGSGDGGNQEGAVGDAQGSFTDRDFFAALAEHLAEGD